MNLAPITEVSATKERSSNLSIIYQSKRRNGSAKTQTKLAATDQTDHWTRLNELRQLLQSGYISKDDFDERTKQIIDQMTGTRGKDQASPKREYIIVPSTPPDFNELTSERAIKYVFLTDGIKGEKQWISFPIRVKVDKYPFSKGGLRYVYHMMEYPDSSDKLKMNEKFKPADTIVLKQQYGLSIHYHPTRPKLKSLDDQGDENNSDITYVCKIAIDPDEDIETYFRDVEMQELCRVYAEKFNSYNPPRRVSFPHAWIVQLVERGNNFFCHVEVFLKGNYKKHNNNFGYVSEDHRNTPQAYSHFTYEASDKELVVVDIQGVQDIYTDPQVHSIDESFFGKGNLGAVGIKKFIQTHKCNPICRYLKLPLVNPFELDAGTIPATQFMREAHIEVMKVSNLHVYETDPIVKNLLPRKQSMEESQQNHSQTLSCCPRGQCCLTF